VRKRVSRVASEGVSAMRDIAFFICTAGFFGVAIVYVWGCERLK
jgi:hypothetical protein